MLSLVVVMMMVMMMMMIWSGVVFVTTVAIPPIQALWWCPGSHDWSPVGGAHTSTMVVCWLPRLVACGRGAYKYYGGGMGGMDVFVCAFTD